MGAFFTNIHLYSDRTNKEELLKDVSDALVRMATQETYQLADEGELADRTTLVYATENPNWFVIYDEDAESQDVSELEKIGKTMSATDGVTAISVLVHDSEYLLLQLFVNGDKKDNLEIRECLKRKGLKKKHWLGLLTEPEIHDLGEKLKQSGNGTEEHLEKAADQLRWDKNYCFLGHDDHSNAPKPACIKLRFKLNPKHQFYRFDTRPPKFDLQEEMSDTVQVGKRTQIFSFVGKYGGENLGVSVYVDAGNDLLKKMEFCYARICPRDNRQEIKSRFILTELQGKQFMVAYFNDLYLAAQTIDLHPGKRMQSGQCNKLNKLLYKTDFYGGVVVKPLVLGPVEIKVWYVPHQNKQQGAALHTYHMDVVDDPKNTRDEFPDL